MLVTSLFSGVGGLDAGFLKNLHFDVVFANDFNKDACATYQKNWGGSHLREGDIADFLSEIPKHDLLIGGFPCQPFSMAGYRKGFEDIRGLEILNFIEAIKRGQPDYFIAENVGGLASMDNGRTLQTIIDFFAELGYRVETRLIQMEQFGVPQRRRRLFIFGCSMRAEVPLSLDECFPKPMSIFAPDLYFERVMQLANLSWDDPMHNLHTSTAVKQHWMQLLKQGENLSKLSEEEIRRREAELGLEHQTIPKTRMGYRRLRADDIAPTMMFGNTCLPIHPTENRNISVREAAIIQGFPRYFFFAGGISSQYKQVGNAVPPLFSMQLADSFARAYKDRLHKPNKI